MQVICCSRVIALIHRNLGLKPNVEPLGCSLRSRQILDTEHGLLTEMQPVSTIIIPIQSKPVCCQPLECHLNLKFIGLSSQLQRDQFFCVSLSERLPRRYQRQSNERLLSHPTVGTVSVPLNNVHGILALKKHKKVMGRIRILLADDHQAVLQRVCELLGEDFDIVGTVNNGRDAVAEAIRLNPDVLVIDISMPVFNGLQAAQQLRCVKQPTKIVFLTVHTDEDFVAAALSAGALGYVTKPDIVTDLVPAISEALAGRIYISKSIRR